MKVHSNYTTIGQARCIVIADVHGKLSWLKRLLKKVNFTPKEDHLFLLGDMIEKGEASLATLQYVMQLSTYPNVHVVKGNCDQIPCEIEYEKKWEQIKRYQIQIDWKQQTLLYEMAEQLSIVWNQDLDMKECVEKLFSAYHKEFAFLRSLPHVIESEAYIFVHGGIELEEPPYAESAYAIMKNDRFASGKKQFHKTVVCGHTPVVNYDDHIANYSPRFDEERNIISIDGGCGIKDEGQLNALILEQGKATYEFVDDLPLYEVKENWCSEQKESINIHWFSKQVELLRYEQGDAICRHCSSGIIIHLPASSIYEISDVYYTNDFTNHQLSLHKGEQVGFITIWHSMALLKHHGIIGWVPKKVIMG